MCEMKYALPHCLISSIRLGGVHFSAEPGMPFREY